MGNTLAIHWAATTHGTWLHGDPRGSWRNGRLMGPDPYLEAECRARMSASAVILDAFERTIIADALGTIVREQPHRVFAATIQAAHVHLVLAPLQEDIQIVIARLKRRSAAAVLKFRRQQQMNRQKTGQDGRAMFSTGQDGRAMFSTGQDGRAICVPKSLWTAGRFPVFIFDDLHLVNAIVYVRDHNRRIGLAADPFDWIDPLFPASEMAGERLYRGAVCEIPHL